MIAAKKRLNCQSLESQIALELPDRETLDVVVIVTIGDVLSGNTININVPNINVATQVCALVTAINFMSDCNGNQPLFCRFN